jgi:hypothetical protein
MNENVSDLVYGLPHWMIFLIVILVITTPLIAETIRTIRIKKEVKNNQKFTDDLKDYQTKLHGTLEVLLDVLYERFANNVTYETSAKIIEITYNRSAHCIIDYLFRHHKLYTLENLDNIDDISDQLLSFISNVYYEDSMFLDKIKCKGISLNVHLKQTKPREILEKIITIINAVVLLNNPTRSKHFPHEEVSRRVIAHYHTLITKAHQELSQQTC